MNSCACCMLRGACRLLLAAILPAACRMLSGSCVVARACCRLHFPCCILHVVWCIYPVACCMLSVVCCTFSSGSLRHCCPLDHVCVPFLCCMPHVLRCMWSVFLLPAPPMLHGVRCLSPGPRRISSRCTLRDARSLSHVVSCPLPVPSCTSSVACRLLPVAE